MKMKCDILIAMALLATSLVTPLCYGQQNFANDLRGTSKSRIATLPIEPGKMETYFINVRDQEVVTSPFRLIFGVVGMGVAPAGVKKPGTGHHHLLIDTSLPKLLGTPIPFSDNYRHFGGGQTEVELTLSPGKHTLQLLFADDEHRPLFKTKAGVEFAVHSKKITIFVEDPAKAPK